MNRSTGGVIVSWVLIDNEGEEGEREREGGATRSNNSDRRGDGREG